MFMLLARLKRLIIDKLEKLLLYIIEASRQAKIDDIRILHYSSNYLIVDKRYDVLINSNDMQQVTVETQVRRLFPDLASGKLTHGFHFAHRLDFSTSGVLCIACNKRAASVATEAFSSRKTRKYYIALVRGFVSQELIDIEMPIGVDLRPEHVECHRMCSGDNPYCQKPRSALTRLLVLEKGLYENYPATKVMLKPVTGRRHQLRVHCSSIGHTIIGDYTYSNRKDTLPHRMFLHSYRLILPTTIETINVCTGDPFRDELKGWSPCLRINNINEETYDKIDNNSPDVIVKTRSLM